MTEPKTETKLAPRFRQWQKNIWSERGFTLLVLVLGVLLGQGVDFWKTFRYVASDVRTHTLSINFQAKMVEIHLAFVNEGNRQGAITDLRVALPVKLEFEKPLKAVEVKTQKSVEMPNPLRIWVPKSTKPFEITGVPTVLNAGDIRLATIKGKIDTKLAYQNALSCEKGELRESEPPDTRKINIALIVRGLDFQGRKYETYWQLCTAFLTKEAITHYKFDPKGIELRVFNANAYRTGTWFPMEVMDVVDSQAEQTPTPSATGAAPQS